MQLDRQTRRAIATEYVNKINSETFCERCGSQPIEWHNPDHIGKGNARVSSLRTQGLSIARIQAEMDVCTPLCRRCHMKEDNRMANLTGGHPKGSVIVPPLPCKCCKRLAKPLRRGLCTGCYNHHSGLRLRKERKFCPACFEYNSNLFFQHPLSKERSMTNLDLTHIYVVLDRSGSMNFIRKDTEGGFNAFIKAQLAQPGECKVTLAQFDDEYEIVYSQKPIQDVPPLTLAPRGSTALYDAVGRTISAAGTSLQALPEDERPGSVIFIILTDGQENASREYHAARIKEMITEQQEKYSWLFKFFGADITAITVADSLGIHYGNALQYAGVNVGQAFTSASGSTASFRSVMASGSSYSAAVLDSTFTDEDRNAAVATFTPEDDDDDTTS